MRMQIEFQQIVAKHREAFEHSFTVERVDLLCEIACEFNKCLKAGNKLLFCGNGGSAADSQHIAAEFVGRFKLDRPGLPALALTTDTSILTAVANDYSFDQIFSRQVEALGKSGDLLIALSTSGMSRNVLEAVKKARDMGLRVVGFTGACGGDLLQLSDIAFIAQHTETSHIQEMHMIALHAISEVVENTFFGA